MSWAGRGRTSGCSPDSVQPLPPDLRLRLPDAAVLDEALTAGPTRLPAHSRDERRLARIDRKVAARDRPDTPGNAL